MQPAGLDALGQILDDVTLNRQEHDLQLALRGLAEQLVVPNNFVDREGYVLLRFVLDDLPDLRLIDGRQLDEPREDGLPGDAENDVGGLDVLFAYDVTHGGNDQRLAVFLVLGVDAEISKVEIRQPQSLALGCLKLANFDCRGANIQRQNSLGT